jgi:hypothetical protein
VTHVLLQEGHLWGRKEVAIPIEAVTRVETGIWLNLSKRQVEDLPPVAIAQSSRRHIRPQTDATRGDLAEPPRESESGQPNPAAGLKWMDAGWTPLHSALGWAARGPR